MPPKVVRSGEPTEEAVEQLSRRARDRAERLGKELERGVKVDVERIDGERTVRDAVREHRRASEGALRKALGGASSVDLDDLPELEDARVGEDW